MNAKASPKVEFRQWTCELVFARYENDRIAIRLVSEDETIAMATVNVPCCPLARDEILIKSYSENEGMLEALIDAGVVEPTGVICKVGQAEAHVCRLLIDSPTVH